MGEDHVIPQVILSRVTSFNNPLYILNFNNLTFELQVLIEWIKSTILFSFLCNYKPVSWVDYECLES